MATVVTLVDEAGGKLPVNVILSARATDTVVAETLAKTAAAVNPVIDTVPEPLMYCPSAKAALKVNVLVEATVVTLVDKAGGKLPVNVILLGTATDTVVAETLAKTEAAVNPVIATVPEPLMYCPLAKAAVKVNVLVEATVVTTLAEAAGKLPINVKSPGTEIVTLAAETLAKTAPPIDNVITTVPEP